MKKLLTSTILAGMMTFSAHATTLDSFFFANQYTKPSISLTEIQAKIDNGTFYNYPYIAGKSTTGLFEDKLKPGTALPQIRNVTSLLKALDKKQVILVADASGNINGCLPIFAELAKQNGVSCDDLVKHLADNQIDGEDFFSNLDDILDKVQAKIDEITSELNDDVQEQLAQELSEEIVEEITEEVTEEVMEDIEEELEEALFDLTEAVNQLFDEATAIDYDLEPFLEAYAEGGTEIQNGLADIVAEQLDITQEQAHQVIDAAYHDAG